jgi:DNA-binding transcriptional LysR family regulator
MWYHWAVVGDLDMRLLRVFVAVAEELHFSRAAARLHVAQQVVSRDVQRLERSLAVRLLDRTSRRVRLTTAGAELLERARPLLAHHDRVRRSVGPSRERLLVGGVATGLVPAGVLDRARRDEDGFEYYTRPVAGLDEATRQLTAGELDVAFGVWPEDATVARPLRSRVLCREPLALLLPRHHVLAARPAVEVADLAGVEVCWCAGNQVTADWGDRARALLASWGARAAPAHPAVRGADELAHHVRDGEPPVLTVAGHPAVPGTALVPLAGPVPTVSWSMLRRADDRHPGVTALGRAADEPAPWGRPGRGDRRGPT